jgi:hypothetical protein
LFNDDPELERYMDADSASGYENDAPEVCATLARASRAAMLKLTSRLDPQAAFKVLPPIPARAADVKLAPGVPPVVRSCLQCHSFAGGASAIPFDRPADLAAILRAPRPGKPALIDDILARVGSGDMPRRGSLSDSEKQDLKAYLERVARD